MKDADRLNAIYDAQIEIISLRPKLRKAKKDDDWSLQWKYSDRIQILKSLIKEHKEALSRAPIVHKTYAPMFSTWFHRSGRVRPKGKTYN